MDKNRNYGQILVFSRIKRRKLLKKKDVIKEITNSSRRNNFPNNFLLIMKLMKLIGKYIMNIYKQEVSFQHTWVGFAVLHNNITPVSKKLCLKTTPKSICLLKKYSSNSDWVNKTTHILEDNVSFSQRGLSSNHCITVPPNTQIRTQLL